MTMHVLESASAEPADDERTLCCGRLVGSLPPGDAVTRNPILYTCSDPGPSRQAQIDAGRDPIEPDDAE
jgi:hypothetical protein